MPPRNPRPNGSGPNASGLNVSDLAKAPQALSAVQGYVETGAALVENLDTAGWEVPGGQDLKDQLTAFLEAATRELQPMIDAADGKTHTAAQKYHDD